MHQRQVKESVPSRMHLPPPPRKRRSARGQSTVEFLLMLPVLCAVLFFIVQTSLYLTTAQYANYVAYSSARAQIGGFNNAYRTVEDVSRLILSGSVWGGETAVPVASRTGAAVRMVGFEQRVPFPFITGIVPSMDFTTSVYLGPRELDYEGVEGRPSDQYDNNSTSR